MRSSYYNGLCFLKKRQFKSARDSFIQSAFAQFAPSIDMLLRMKEMGLGGKELLSVDSFFGSVLLTRLKEHFVSIPAVTQRTSYNCAGDPLCLRAARQRPRPPVHDAVRGSEHSLLGVPLYRPLREAPVEGGIPRFRALREGRRRAVPPVHGVAAVHLAEQRARNRRRDYDVGGKHGYVQDVERARRMLETSKTPDAKFYLGWCWARFVMRSLLNQLPWLGKENIEVSKMNLDEASEREGKG